MISREIGFILIVAIGGYMNVIFLRIILGFLQINPSPTLRPAFNFIYDVTEPFLRLFRRLLPTVSLGGMGLDLSPILAFIVLIILRGFVANLFNVG